MRCVWCVFRVPFVLCRKRCLRFGPRFVAQMHEKRQLVCGRRDRSVPSTFECARAVPALACVERMWMKKEQQNNDQIQNKKEMKCTNNTHKHKHIKLRTRRSLHTESNHKLKTAHTCSQVALLKGSIMVLVFGGQSSRSIPNSGLGALGPFY